MSFIRNKTVRNKKGVTVHQMLVENYRENGKVKQRVICYLPDRNPKDCDIEQANAEGRVHPPTAYSTVEEALNYWAERVMWDRNLASLVRRVRRDSIHAKHTREIADRSEQIFMKLRAKCEG